MQFVAVSRRGQTYLFVYDEASAPTLARQLLRMTADPKLDFTARDAATVWKSVRRLRGAPAQQE
jgi:hypothetical protein